MRPDDQCFVLWLAFELFAWFVCSVFCYKYFCTEMNDTKHNRNTLMGNFSAVRLHATLRKTHIQNVDADYYVVLRMGWDSWCAFSRYYTFSARTYIRDPIYPMKFRFRFEALSNTYKTLHHILHITCCRKEIGKVIYWRWKYILNWKLLMAKIIFSDFFFPYRSYNGMEISAMFGEFKYENVCVCMCGMKLYSKAHYWWAFIM